MTPAMSLSRSQRETWTTTGSPGPGRPSPVIAAGRVTTPVLPSSRTKDVGPGATSPSTPIVARMLRTVSSSRSSFFGESGSIDGGMIATFSPGSQDGTYSRREKTNLSAAARYGRRNPHPARVASFSQSTPMWLRHVTRAPAPARAAASPAVCGSCSSTRSPGRIWPSNSVALAASISA